MVVVVEKTRIEEQGLMGSRPGFYEYECCVCVKIMICHMAIVGLFYCESGEFFEHGFFAAFVEHDFYLNIVVFGIDICYSSFAESRMAYSHASRK